MNTNKSILEGIISEIRTIIPDDRVMTDEPMNRHTSFRIGGPAAVFVTVNDERELSGLLKLLSKLPGEDPDNVPEHMIIGRGSNFLVADEGYPGIMIMLGGEFEEISQDAEDECLVTAGAARSLGSTSSFLTENGLAGAEFASGIPGSVGGAVFMNAGAYGGEMKDIVETVRLMEPDGSKIITLTSDQMDFGYRHSMVEESGMIVLSAALRLEKDDPEAIMERVLDLQNRRNSKQPVNYPSAGSTFKRPVGGYAAALIDQAGLKGYSIGGAQVSEKHAGFVINTGGATAEDVLALMRHIREEVYKTSGIMLEPEVRLIGCSL